MTLMIENTNAIQTPWTVWFLYGATGSGKTTIAASFPEPLFLVPANEGSELTLRGRNLPFIRVGKAADGTIIPVRQHLTAILDDLTKQHHLMRAAMAKGDDAAAFAAFPWQTIVIESLTHLGDMLVEDVSVYGTKKMDQQLWGLISGFLRTLHSRLRNMDVHVVYTALQKTVENEATGIVTGGPNLIGATAEKLPSACDVIAYCEETSTGKNESRYRVHFRKNGSWVARSRFQGFPPHLDNFNFAQVRKHLGLD
jgi:hypothetical protein